MNIKEQVLSLEQIKELQELGFDFRKYSSACVIEAKDRNKYIIDRRLIGLHIGFMETEVIEYHETLTIGDIISVLPPHIYPSVYHKKYGKEIEQTHLLIMYPFGNFGCLIRYKHHNRDTFVFESIEKPYIKALFETLKWCIKNKYININK